MTHPMMLDRGLRVKVVPSSFGGGWLFGLNDPSREYLRDLLHEDAVPLPPFGCKEGHIIEPCAWFDVLSACGEDNAELAP